jgi:DNA-binding response OmpR family regulator
MTVRLLMIEDDQRLAAMVGDYLGRAGFELTHAADAASGFERLKASSFDLVILDLMLPDADGLDVCRAIRRHDAWRSIPIIMVTAKGSETDRVLGLELGADDYVVKPIVFKELAARIRAVLRRGRMEPLPARISIGGGEIEMDLERFEVRIAGNPVELTTTEFKLLHLLASKPGRVFTRDQLLDQIWGGEKIVLDRTIDVHVKNLREKMGPTARILKNIRGVGYKIEP